MDCATRWWQIAGILAVAWCLALGGCPADDDDSADDDAGDDDAADDDAATLFSLEQDLAGTTSGTPCPDCDYTLDITYTEVQTEGTCIVCLFFPDGTWTLAYDSDYLENYSVILMGAASNWYFWYSAYPEQDGHTIAFDYAGAGYSQSGYWDVVGEATMTGKAYNTEP